MKQLIFRSYVFVAIGVLVLGVGGATLFTDKANQWQIIGATIAGVLSYCYFVQQQRLAETQLFKQLFTEFNARYDSLNDDLAAIVAGRQPKREDSSVITDYFNLCAEKYLFYQQGYILEEVWRSWCRGMQQYLDDPHFSAVWTMEVRTQSHYGLSREVIVRGARLT